MKIAIECRSPLLQKSLENFLEGHLCSAKNCELFLSDQDLVGRDNFLRIGSDAGADIIKPFSKSQLLLKLEHYFKVKEDAAMAMHMALEMDEPIQKEEPTRNVKALDGLEEKIERLTASYVQGVMSLVKEYRG